MQKLKELNTYKRSLIMYLEYTLHHPNVSDAKQRRNQVKRGTLRSTFWAKVGLDLSKRQNVARGKPSLTCIFFIKFPHAKVERARHL